MAGTFLDSNIVLYVASADPAKADIAEMALRRGGIASVQVLNEVAHVCRRKLGFGFVETETFLEMVRELVQVVPLDIETHKLGLAVAARHRLSVWDGMIAAAALRAGCDQLFSEDLHPGLVIDGRLRVANPFAALRG